MGKDAKVIVCTKQLARIIGGKSPRWVHKLCDAGIIEKVSRGQWDLETVIPDYVKHLQNTKETPSPHSDVKLRLETTRAAREELKLQEEKAELIDVSEAMIMWGKVMQAFRARILSIPKKVAPIIFGCRNIAEAESILKKATNEALKELSNPDLVAKALDIKKAKRTRSNKRK